MAKKKKTAAKKTAAKTAAIVRQMETLSFEDLVLVLKQGDALLRETIRSAQQTWRDVFSTTSNSRDPDLSVTPYKNKGQWYYRARWTDRSGAQKQKHLGKVVPDWIATLARHIPPLPKD